MSSTDELLRELIEASRELVAALRTLPREIAAELAARERTKLQRGARTGSRDNAGELLARIHDRMGASEPTWTVSELLTHARTSDAPLRSAIETLVGPLGTGSGRKLGRYLASIEGCNFGGVALTREGGSSEGAIWCAKLVSKTHKTHETPLAS